MKNNLIKNITLGAILFVPGTTIINNNTNALASNSIGFVRSTSPEVQAATTAVATAEGAATTTNISIARELVNQLPEGVDKDGLQNRLNALVVITDLDFPRKSVSAHLDVYIRCENMLSLSLSTNKVTFEEFSGVEDAPMENAVTLTVNSSLAYDVNAYLPTAIMSADNQQEMDKDILEIKANGEPDYQKFPGIGTGPSEKVVLLSNQEDGNNITHGIDLQLAGNIAHEADIYKTTIKFEVAQK